MGAVTGSSLGARSLPWTGGGVEAAEAVDDVVGLAAGCRSQTSTPLGRPDSRRESGMGVAQAFSHASFAVVMVCSIRCKTMRCAALQPRRLGTGAYLLALSHHVVRNKASLVSRLFAANSRTARL